MSNRVKLLDTSLLKALRSEVYVNSATGYLLVAAGLARCGGTFCEPTAAGEALLAAAELWDNQPEHKEANHE